MGRVIVVFVALLLMGQSVSAQSDKSVIELNKQARELYLKKNFVDAEKTYNEAIKIQIGDGYELNNDNYTESLSGIAGVYLMDGKYGKCDSICNIVMQFTKEAYGKKSLEYAEALNNVARIRLQQQQLAGVYDILKTALDIRGEILGESHIDYGMILDGIGTLYTYMGEFTKAVEVFNKNAEIIYKTQGENTPQYAVAMIQLGNTYLSLKDFAQAEKYYIKGAEISKTYPDEMDMNRMISLICLSTLYGNMDRFEDGLKVTFEALPIIEKNCGKESLYYAGAISNIGLMYYRVGNSEKAEPILNQSLSLSHSVVGKQHNYYFNTLNALAALYRQKGLYEKAEPLFAESLSLRKDLYGKSHPSIVLAINNSASFYFEMGNYSVAEKLVLEAMELTTSSLGENSLDYARELNLLASICIQRNEYNLAVNHIRKAISIQKQIAGEDNVQYVLILESLCRVLVMDNTQQPDLIETQLLELIQKWSLILGENNNQYINSLNLLANFYDIHGEYKKARDLYNRGFNFLKDRENENLYHTFLLNAGMNLELTSQFSEARSYYDKHFEITKLIIQNNFAFLSESERELYWKSINSPLKYFISFSDRYSKTDPSQATLAYNCELFSKSLLLNSSLQIQQAIRNSNDSVLIELWDKSMDLKKKPEKYKDKINNIEKELVARSKLYKDIHNQFDIKWEDVKNVLDDGEIAIEFVNFNQWISPKEKTIRKYYSALLIRHDSQYPEIINLGDEDSVRYMMKHREKLYEFLLRPIEKHLKDIKEVYISPSGLLSTVSFAGISNGNDYLIDNYNIHNLLSTKDLVIAKSENSENINTKNILLFGGADFNLSTSALAEADKGFERPNNVNLTRGMLDKLDKDRGQGFDYLPGSKEEVLSIDKMLSNLGWTSTVFTDKDATETRLKAISSNSPEILHISTHGFYFPQPLQETDPLNPLNFVESKNVFKVSDNPLMRSGLLFSGANSVWSGNEPEEDIDDGILTAYEISNLNLSNTKLVVLSACESGLGDIDYSEGVYGLQRAFRLAGVKSLVVSLWNVPDKETSEMMIELYKHLSNGIDVKKAFSRSQQKMRKSYPDNPEKWAGFVLIE